MRQIKLRTALIAIILTAVIVGTVAAAVLYSVDFSNSAVVETSYKIRCTVEDDVTVVETIDWGEFVAEGESKSINTGGVLINGVDLPVGGDLIIWNDGSVRAYMAWTHTSLPTGVTVTAQLEATRQSGDFQAWPMGDHNYLQIEPGTSSGRIVLTLATSGTTPPGAFNFTVTFNSADTPSG